ncbi:flagellar basal-body MS-ring/collar protein FliF [Crenobacter sp. SG2303]|uniref:Flagellar M-ring protein n=1 Tax=Crenobacter oryzisoli TaxID=3056844 RepID=A0ABT7XK64_9NEIS|nr:flagellar basal-body MS-ring/collar protein FliF [Crenobacter sp. SG2303]MDN0074179.1 flagellar basal-body MS-ring/collar protein FliF [Crenobacter sp. SG2303]
MSDQVDNATPAWRTQINRVVDRFKALPLNRKLLFAGAVAAILSVVIGLVLLNRTPSYKVLFANLSDHDGGQITSVLQQQNIPYQLSDGGVISVPADKVYDVRLKLASQGLPKAGGVGFELMDNQKFGISQFAEQVNYQRSIEGELGRTIESVSSVKSARVHLAIPKQSVFVRDAQSPTASVMLDLYPGRMLDAAQVSGILHLVSSSVPGLSLKDVSVVDQDGNLLSSLPDLNNASGLDQRQRSFVRDLETDYSKRIETILNPIFGKGNVHAQVTAQVDFSEVEQTSETYRPNSSPNPSATRSQQIVEKLANANPLPGGVPGALTNQPPSAASAPISLPPGTAPGSVTLSGQPMGATGTLDREITTNYEVDKTVQHITQPKGNVKRLSAAVVVNYRLLPDRGGELKPTALTAKEVEQITNLARQAIGYSQDRGDSLNVVNAAFAGIEGPATMKDKVIDFMSANVWELAKYGLLGLALLYLILGVIRPIMRDVVRPAALEPALAGAGGPAVDGEGQAGSAGSLIAVVDDNEASTAGNGDGRERMHRQYSSNLEHARELVKADPRMAAQVIKEWISADE